MDTLQTAKAKLTGWKVDWLEGHGRDEESLNPYSEFAKEIDTVLMGRNTYHQMVTELSVSRWIYEDFRTYVFTQKQSEKSS